MADRYRVERELGAGGMATVYLARDLKHDRDFDRRNGRMVLTEPVSVAGARIVVMQHWLEDFARRVAR